MRHFLLFIFLLSYGAIFAQGFTIDGSVLHSYEGKIYLIYGNKIDSVQVVNQSFSFEGKVPYPIKANLTTDKNNKQTGFIILENSPLTANIVIENKRNVHFKSLHGSQTITKVKDFIIYKNKNRKLPNLSELLFYRLSEIIRSNPKNQFYGMLLAETLSERKISYQQAEKLVQMLDFKTQDPEDIDKIKTLMETLQKTQIGATFPDIELPDNKDNISSLNHFKKNFTLISFSSTDCIACVELDRKYKEIYNEYKKKGFTVYEIFLEDDKETWLSHLGREKITWKSVIALKKYNNPVVKSIGIIEVPTNFLLDSSGKIIAINIGPNLLSRKLSELLP